MVLEKKCCSPPRLCGPLSPSLAIPSLLRGNPNSPTDFLERRARMQTPTPPPQNPLSRSVRPFTYLPSSGLAYPRPAERGKRAIVVRTRKEKKKKTPSHASNVVPGLLQRLLPEARCVGGPPYTPDGVTKGSYGIQLVTALRVARQLTSITRARAPPRPRWGSVRYFR